MPLTAVSTTVTPGTAGTKKFPKFSNHELRFTGDLLNVRKTVPGT